MNPKRNYETPDDVKKAFEEYKEHLEVESQKWVKVQYVGKEGDRKTDPYKLPYTLEGFYRFCRNNKGDVRQYFLNFEGLYADYLTICSDIREEIRENQITGGLLGIYNPSITQRLNGLVEKSQVAVREQPLFPDEN